MNAQILQPVVALAVWTMVMWFWMYAVRFPAIGKVGPEALAEVKMGTKTLDQLLPPQAQWKAHNYNHLHEAPTVFYAIALVLALAGAGDGLNAQVAWVYVGLRVVHSLIQATVNNEMARFMVFALSSFALMTLIARAAMVVFA